MSKARDIADLDFNSPDIDGGNIDGATIGASTAAAGSFTAVSATSDITVGAGVKLKYNSDRFMTPENNVDGAEISSNGIFKVKTGSTPVERFYINSFGNVGFGVTPETNISSTWQHIQFGGTGALIARHADNGVDAMFSSNYYVNGSNVDSYLVDGTAARIFLNGSNISIQHAGSGTADSALTWATPLSIDASGNTTLSGDLKLDSSNAEINLKSGVGGTTGAINWTFNTDDSNFVAVKLPYDSRASVGLHIDSGYPITLDYSVSGSDGLRMSASGVMHNRFNSSGAHFNTPESSNLDFKVSSAGDTNMLFVDAGSNEVGIGTNAPENRLEIEDDNSSTTHARGLTITNFSLTTNSRAGILFKNYDNHGASIYSPRTGSTQGKLILATNTGYNTTEASTDPKLVILHAGGTEQYASVHDARWFNDSSAFSNPTIDLFTGSTTGTNYPQSCFEVTMYGNGVSANEHQVFRGGGTFDYNSTSNGTAQNLTTYTNYHVGNALPAAPTFSLSGNTLQITCYRQTNYDSYRVEVRVWGRSTSHAWGTHS